MTCRGVWVFRVVAFLLVQVESRLVRTGRVLFKFPKVRLVRLRGRPVFRWMTI